MEDLLKQMKRDNEDLKLKLDAILSAIVLPQLGENKSEIKVNIENSVRGIVGRKIWNSINGENTLAEIGTKVKQSPQSVLSYIKRWEQASPSLVYVTKIKEGNKIYKRIFEVNLKKLEKAKKKK